MTDIKNICVFHYTDISGLKCVRVATVPTLDNASWIRVNEDLPEVVDYIHQIWGDAEVLPDRDDVIWGAYWKEEASFFQKYGTHSKYGRLDHYYNGMDPFQMRKS
jgi:hypothetical protein